MMKRLLLAPILCMLLLGSLPLNTFGQQKVPKSPVYVLEVQELDAVLRKSPNGTPQGKGFYLVDVRTPDEHKSGVIPGTDINIDHSEIFKRHTEIGASKDDHIVMYCQSGRRSNIAAEVLTSLGYKFVYNLKGSMGAWKQKQFPVIPPTIGTFNNQNPGQPPTR